MSGVRSSIVAVVLCWVAMIGVDLSLHAGLLAPVYDWGSPFLLSPGDAFARIPIGYLSFLVLAAALAWLLMRLGVRTGRDGALIGAIQGGARIRSVALRVVALVVAGAVVAVVLQSIGYATAPGVVQ